MKNIVLADQLKMGLENGTYKSLQQMATIHQCTISYARRILLLAYLAPDITKSILEGSQPASVTITKLTAQKLPLDWNEQRQYLGYGNA
jgi:site-specific DNA recombinase